MTGQRKNRKTAGRKTFPFQDFTLTVASGSPLKCGDPLGTKCQVLALFSLVILDQSQLPGACLFARASFSARIIPADTNWVPLSLNNCSRSSMPGNKLLLTKQEVCSTVSTSSKQLHSLGSSTTVDDNPTLHLCSGVDSSLTFFGPAKSMLT